MTTVFPRRPSSPHDEPAVADPPAGVKGHQRWLRWWPTLAGLTLMVCFHLLAQPFFPNRSGNLGHDYSFFLPEILAGDYWFWRNGAFAVPWFTPAFCGGIPLYGDPQSVYYSLGQWLSFLFDPVHAIYMSILAFAALGLWGTYRLARDVFRVATGPALLAAGVFLFNGFYFARMVIGHYAFHAFMLVPLIAWLLCRPDVSPRARALPAVLRQTKAKRERAELFHTAAMITLAACALAYMVIGGMTALLLPALLALGLLIALHAVVNIADIRPLALVVRLAVTGAFAVLLAGSRLQASLAFLHQFPRDDLPLPGYSNLRSAVSIMFDMLFLPDPDVEFYSAQNLVNAPFQLGRHELEYGVGQVALGFLAVGFMLSCMRYFSRPERLKARVRQRGFALAALLSMALLPVVLNVYEPTWNMFLKKLPVIGTSSNLVRWVAAYIPILAVTVGLSANMLPTGLARAASSAGLVVLIVMQFEANHDSYRNEPYSVANVRHAYRDLWVQGKVPPVVRIGVFRDANGQLQWPLFRNDVLTVGTSPLTCYQPMFGYGLEHLPVKNLQPGKVMSLNPAGEFNIKNPACYLFPNENKCSPGDQYKLAQLPAALSFVDYRPVPFERSRGQVIADDFSALAIVMAGVILLGWLAARRRAGRSFTAQ